MKDDRGAIIVDDVGRQAERRVGGEGHQIPYGRIGLTLWSIFDKPTRLC